MAESSVEDVLLRRRGLVYADAQAASATEPAPWIAGVELELAELGYVLSTRLRGRLARLPVAELGRRHLRLWEVLTAAKGADVVHRPLFRRFPEDVPADTSALWWKKVLVHFVQAPDQPCLFCRRAGSTRVLRPCQHVVCERCFDGSNYTACPVCERQVDRGSPFFGPEPEQEPALGDERPRFELLDLGEDLAADARALLVSLCERAQAPSPADRDDLVALLEDLGEGALEWLPAKIPVKESVATVFGALFRRCDPAAVLPAARAHLSTATDVLRFVAALSGADPALQGEHVYKPVDPDARPRRWWGEALEKVLVESRRSKRLFQVQLHVRRFKVARLPRPLRRALLELLEGCDPQRLIEDMLRHRSYWVWVGQLLHPHEHAARFPGAARAFAVVRRKGPDGRPAPAFEGYYARLEAAARAQDPARLLAVLRERPGELARRFDHALRVAGDDEGAQDRVLEAFVGCVEGSQPQKIGSKPVQSSRVRRRVHQALRPSQRSGSVWSRGPKRTIGAPSASRRGAPAASRAMRYSCVAGPPAAIQARAGAARRAASSSDQATTATSPFTNMLTGSRL